MASTPALTPSLAPVPLPSAQPATVHHASERWRKPVSFLFAAAWLGLALLVRPDGFQDVSHSIMEMTGFLLLIVAALGRVWAFAYIGGRKNQELCRGGPYSLTRNPLHLFSFLGVCGAGLALQSPTLFVIAALFFLGYYAVVIRAEESRLRGIFGSAFVHYRAEVPRFLAAPAAARHRRGTHPFLPLASALPARGLLVPRRHHRDRSDRNGKIRPLVAYLADHFLNGRARCDASPPLQLPTRAKRGMRWPPTSTLSMNIGCGRTNQPPSP